ncbi:MAG: hypothetical protein AAF078_14010 [Planctomycetota bacterium]
MPSRSSGRSGGGGEGVGLVVGGLHAPAVVGDAGEERGVAVVEGVGELAEAVVGGSVVVQGDRQGLPLSTHRLGLVPGGDEHGGGDDGEPAGEHDPAGQGGDEAGLGRSAGHGSRIGRGGGVG